MRKAGGLLRGTANWSGACANRAAAISGLGAACIASPLVGIFPTGVPGTSLTRDVYFVGHI